MNNANPFRTMSPADRRAAAVAACVAARAASEPLWAQEIAAKAAGDAAALERIQAELAEIGKGWKVASRAAVVTWAATCPDGTVMTRRSDNAYSHAVVLKSNGKWAATFHHDAKLAGKAAQQRRRYYAGPVEIHVVETTIIK